MVEWIDDNPAHQSRNPFVPIKEVAEFQHMLLRFSILNFLEEKPGLTVDELIELANSED
jgi:hypothetical protein